MKYFYTPPETWTISKGRTYDSKHPLYSRCTLYEKEDKGLAVIQQRFNPRLKIFWWSTIDPWLVDDLYSQPGFSRYFDEHAGTCTDGIFPTVTIRQIMWALRMKPLKKEYWENSQNLHSL